jgi:hypothetical protein
MLALLVLADDAPLLCATPAARPSMAESFSLGTGGDTLCQVESTPTDALAPGLFDRAYAVICRDAAAPVGHLYALSADQGDPGLRIDAHRDSKLHCVPGAGAPLAEGGTAVTLHCTAPDGLSYDALRNRRGRVLYAAEGLSGYR